MPVPAIVAVGSETHEDAPHPKGPPDLAQGEWLVEDVLQRPDTEHGVDRVIVDRRQLLGRVDAE